MKKRCLNPRRFTKKQVQELIAAEGKLHQEFTNCFTQNYANGYCYQPLIYELTADRFLFVFDPKSPGSGGKGDIYAREYFLQWVRSTKRHRQDIARGCCSSVSHWHYYSQHRETLIYKINFLVTDLAEKLSIDPQKLDFSYPSLDIISKKTENYGCNLDSTSPNFAKSVDITDHDPQPYLIDHLYDHLVAYVGEVLRHRIQGEWVISDSSMDESSPHKYPYIRTISNKILMPINVVWQELVGILPMKWRLETANEIRRHSF